MKFVLILLSLVLSTTSFASYDEILDIAEKYNREKKNIGRLEVAKRSALKRVFSLEKRTHSVAKEKSKMQREKINLDQKIALTSRRIIKLEDLVRDKTLSLSQRNAVFRNMSGVPWMDILFSSGDPVQLEKNLFHMKRFNQFEVETVYNHVQTIHQYKEEKKKLSGLIRNLIGLTKKISEKEKSLRNQHRQRKTILSSLEKKLNLERVNFLKNRKKGLAKASHFDMREMRLLFSTSFYENKGNIPQPAHGPLVQGFGLNEVLKSENIKVLHKGHFYRLSQGAPCNSIAMGKVRFSGKIKSLGQVVIIDHSSNYFSVYSNMAQSSVKKGSIVEAGQQVGQAGALHQQYGSGLYFELRHFSEPQNPADWLKKQKNENLVQEFTSEEGKT